MNRSIWIWLVLAALFGGAFALSDRAAARRPADGRPAAPAQGTPTPTPTPCGLAWRAIYSPNAGTLDNYLNDVVATSSNDVWAVGDYFEEFPLLEHWDGASW